MVTAILPSLTDDSAPCGDYGGDASLPKIAPAAASSPRRNHRHSALSIESQLTITPERFAESLRRGHEDAPGAHSPGRTDATDGSGAGNPSQLAGLVGLFTGCGALVALVLFLPLPADFGRIDGTTMAQAVAYSFYTVAAVAAAVAALVFVGLRNLRGEDGKGWALLFGRPSAAARVVGDSVAARHDELVRMEDVIAEGPPSSTNDADADALSYWRLLRDSVELGARDADIALGYLGGFVARASTVAISLFVPLFINAFFIGNGFCQGAPNDPSPELKKECRAAYVLAAILTGVAQLLGLLCAPLFGYLSSAGHGRSRSQTRGYINMPVVVASALGVVGYVVFPQLSSPEFRDDDGRGGSPAVFVVVALMGISQIGAIVCSLGALGRGVLKADRSPDGDMCARDRDVFAASTEAHVDAPEPAPLLIPADDADADSDEDDADTINELVASPHSARARALDAATAQAPPPRMVPVSVASSRPAPAASSPAPAACASRIRLKGSVAGVYSWCGGAAILLLTKLGGYLFDHWSRGAPFYMMALFNGLLLVASLGIDASRAFRRIKI